MFNIKTPHLFLLLGLIAPVHSFAAEAYCIAVNGGSSEHGTTFVARNFSLPGESKCTPWSGYTVFDSIVIFTGTGTSCLSGDSKVLTVSVSSADPVWLNSRPPANDYIQLSRADSTQPFKGEDTGLFTGPAEPVTCTSDLLYLPSSHL
jgi:hypothetical protein